jgi:hypothetical protein
MADPHWRNTAVPLRISVFKLFSVDARALAPFVPLLLVKSWKLFAIGCIFMFFFLIIERKGFTFPNFLRAARVKLSGLVKSVRPLE